MLMDLIICLLCILVLVIFRSLRVYWCVNFSFITCCSILLSPYSLQFPRHCVNVFLHFPFFFAYILCSTFNSTKFHLNIFTVRLCDFMNVLLFSRPRESVREFSNWNPCHFCSKCGRVGSAPEKTAEDNKSAWNIPLLISIDSVCIRPFSVHNLTVVFQFCHLVWIKIQPVVGNRVKCLDLIYKTWLDPCLALIYKSSIDNHVLFKCLIYDHIIYDHLLLRDLNPFATALSFFCQDEVSFTGVLDGCTQRGH